MIPFLKKVARTCLPDAFIEYMCYLNHIDYRAHLFFERGSKGTSVSDFFLYRSGQYETQYIAENVVGMLLDSPVMCNHKITCYDRNGNICGDLNVSTTENHIKIMLSEVNGKLDEYGGFVHTTQYDSDSSDSMELKIKSLRRLHRGYTGYRNIEYSDHALFSYTHGNFGGLSIDDQGNIIRRAALRKPFCYVPQFYFESEFRYELGFSNPISETLEINIHSVVTGGNDLHLDCLEIPPMGSGVFELDPSRLPQGETGSCIYWVSKLPLCRAFCFEHNPRTLPKSVQVFHT